MAAADVLQFAPLSSTVDVTFWHELAEKKVNELQLSEKPVPIHGYYATGRSEAVPARVCLSAGAFDADYSAPPFHFKIPGTLYNANTVEAFKTFDKAAMFADVTEQIWQDILSGAAVEDPSKLFHFLLITFADLKKFRYYYMFAFPGLMSEEAMQAEPAVPISNVFSTSEQESIKTQYQAMRNCGGESEVNVPAVLLKRTGDGVELAALSEGDNGFFGDGDEVTLVFADPCPRPSHPGWLLRNLLWLCGVRFGSSDITVVCYREVPGGDIEHSIVIKAHLPNLRAGDDTTPPTPKAVGWEKNTKGKLMPRSVDLAGMMDPTRLADTSVDLNLKLMRWRLLPSLDLDKLQATRCLLLGSGTLGCNVARNLMGWGVRHITFVDYGRVSFSNPVRQSLFEFDDCLLGGKPKAEAAAARLKSIFPNIDSEGVKLSIPMPGHPVEGEAMEASVREDVEKLRSLIEAHDVVFLLMDTRESRWLPSLMAADMNKLVINTALGFDTYLVMRHGPGPDEAEASGRPRLGCYYCNDVVAPSDSMRDRTLDQQCTVTRPGLSMIASALAVELMVSLMHHEEGILAPADTAEAPTKHIDNALGLIPHIVRGYLTHFHNALVVGSAYDKCTACAPVVVNEYRENGFDFLLKVFNSPRYLEDVVGLTQMKADADAADWDISDDSGDDF